ncbi:MAG: hypothetical protein ABIA12_00735 [Candidatus Aenigmatarchaeota archaeon]
MGLPKEPVEWRAYVSACTHSIRLAIAHSLAVFPERNSYEDLVNAVSEYYRNVNEWEPPPIETIDYHLERHMLGEGLVKMNGSYVLSMPEVSVKYVTMLYGSKDGQDFWKLLGELENEIGYESPKLGLME